MLDHKQWYDYHDSEKALMKLVDLCFASAMGVPGGGKTFITPRMTRHLNLVSLATFDEGTMTRIFKKIISWFMKNNFKNPDILKLDHKVVVATLEIY
jgi:dynein heavy chain